MTESSAVTAAALAETNVFARPWALDLGLPDFAAVRHEDIEPAVRAGMAAQRREWEAVACDGAEPTIANTVAALERSGELLDRALTVLGTLTSTTHCPDLDELEEALAPELSAHTDAHDLDVRLYRRFKALDDLVRAAREAGVEPVDADGAPVDGPTARLIRLTVEAFERDGVALTGADADRLRAINSRLTGLTTRFGTLAANAMHAAGVANFTADPGLATAESHAARVELLARSMGRGLGGEYDPRGLVVEIARLRAERAAHPGVNRGEVRAAVVAVTRADRTRAPYDERKAAQDARLGLPLVPTTTIGSFPQTSEIRRARAAHRRGELGTAGYEDAMRAEIRRVVRLQEEIGLDVLVHGEAERNDMVQYFAELLDGFVTTEHGWVQSYGSRCTRPSILWGDVSRPEPMTVAWSAYAQSLTDRPMKGMLTGPVTIMAWSFVRDDVPRAQVADQLGLALRAEVADLEAAGIPVVQVDEPAIRETLPLRRADRPAYLEWSVGAFRLATGGAAAATQVHTHLCYSEFDVVIDAVDHLDADVTSIEASRSRMDVLPAVAAHGFERQLGPGVWDIHSPRVPSTDECAELLRRAAAALGIEKLWANPDCGLKTRAYAETVASLRHLVEAARRVRAGA